MLLGDVILHSKEMFLLVPSQAPVWSWRRTSAGRRWRCHPITTEPTNWLTRTLKRTGSPTAAPGHTSSTSSCTKASSSGMYSCLHLWPCSGCSEVWRCVISVQTTCHPGGQRGLQLHAGPDPGSGGRRPHQHQHGAQHGERAVLQDIPPTPMT